DIVYGTNNEFGFDYLRDNMVQTPDALVQGKLHFAMVDEVDSVLIDDARTPLIISGPIPRGDEHEFYQLKPRIERLVHVQKAYINTVLNDAKKALAAGDSDVEGGGLALLRAYRGLPKNKALIKFLSEGANRSILQKVENYYMQEQNKNMPKVDAELYFVIDEKNNQVELTEKGIELITATGEDPSFFILPDVGTEIAEIEKSSLTLEEKAAQKEDMLRDYSIKAERIHSINQLLKAYTLFENDVEYIVDEGKVKIVDEQTGRIMDGRRYSDGLHQAIEAKENVKVEDATQTYATITLQNYFRMYHKLSGMTGTASTEAGELWEIYKLDVVEIPTNRGIQRDDRQDLIYRTAREKYNAVAEEIQRLTEQGRPVLVGTTSVEISELLSRMLQLRKIKHNVLNAKLHQKEADIVAEAGRPGQVTIATNMAGRGTDIKLTEEVKKAGGLAIIGTERHESRRVDRQLRGRAGRQGDPGSSQFFVSLEDNLMRLFASERISNIMVKMGVEE
ncbi:helicase-related protein, partial [Sphingobacterium multivorum]